MASSRWWNRCCRGIGRTPNRAALAGILCVLRTGVSGTRYRLSWAAAATRAGAGWASGTRPGSGSGCIGSFWSGCRTRAPWIEAGRRSTAPACLRTGGAEVGPNPTDRGKLGAKRHLVIDAQGTPLGLTLSGANRHDSPMLAPTLNAVPGVRTRHRGRPRPRPTKLHADKAYGHRRCRRECRARGFPPRISRHGSESSTRLGRPRWVVDRTFAWLARFRRQAICYERRADIHLALTTLACAVICCARL